MVIGPIDVFLHRFVCVCVCVCVFKYDMLSAVILLIGLSAASKQY